jgi:hypothetical protein
LHVETVSSSRFLWCWKWNDTQMAFLGKASMIVSQFIWWHGNLVISKQIQLTL